MRKKATESTYQSNVFIAPEGFLDQCCLPFIQSHDVSIIRVRTLSDGPVIQTIHRHPDRCFTGSPDRKETPCNS
jgi:hypothetical protein